MKQEINTTKEVSNEPLYFEMKDNFSSFFISDSDILKCVLVADSNKKIPTLTDDWIRQAKDYILKNNDIVESSAKNIAKFQNVAEDFYCPDCGNSDFCFLFKDAKHEFILPLEQIVFCLFVCKEEHVIVDTYPNFWMLLLNYYPSLQNLTEELIHENIQAKQR